MPGMRLFVAVWPPEDVIAALADLPRPESDSVRWSTPPQWHVTLRFLGNVADVDGVVAALAEVEHPAVDVEIGPATKKLGPSVLMLPVRGVDPLAAALPFSFDRPFEGHLTVARARNRRQIPRQLEGIPFAASWQATSFSLVRSQTRPDGAVYEDVASFPLR
jgi:RNA 2',3'-cyclic 3'-phosphodiesterase